MLSGVLLINTFLPVDSNVPCEGTNRIDAFAAQMEGRLKRMEVRTFAGEVFSTTVDLARGETRK